MDLLSQCSKVLYDRELMQMRRELNNANDCLRRLTLPPKIPRLENCKLDTFVSLLDKLYDQSIAINPTAKTNVYETMLEGCELLFSRLGLNINLRELSWSKNLFERAQMIVDVCMPVEDDEENAVQTRVFLGISVYKICWTIITSSFFEHNKHIQTLIRKDAGEAEWAALGYTKIEMKYITSLYDSLQASSNLIIFEPVEPRRFI